MFVTPSTTTPTSTSSIAGVVSVNVTRGANVTSFSSQSCTTPAACQFTYLPALTPSISSISPTSGGNGTVVLIRGTNFGSISAAISVVIRGVPMRAQRKHLDHDPVQLHCWPGFSRKSSNLSHSCRVWNCCQHTIFCGCASSHECHEQPAILWRRQHHHHFRLKFRNPRRQRLWNWIHCICLQHRMQSAVQHL